MNKDDAPPPAEAATEVGQEPDFYDKEFVLEELGSIVLWGIGIIAVVGLIAFLVGRFV